MNQIAREDKSEKLTIEMNDSAEVEQRRPSTQLIRQGQLLETRAKLKQFVEQKQRNGLVTAAAKSHFIQNAPRNHTASTQLSGQMSDELGHQQLISQHLNSGSGSRNQHQAQSQRQLHRKASQQSLAERLDTAASQIRFMNRPKKSSSISNFLESQPILTYLNKNKLSSKTTSISNQTITALNTDR